MKLTRPELDELLVDYLYDELSDEQRLRFEQALDEHPELEAEVAAHRMTRRVAASLPEATLPPAAMARLEDVVMAAAREAADAAARQTAQAPEAAQARGQADAAASRPSWWQRLLALMAQPAFATAVAAVLVVGVWAGLRGDTRQGPVAPHVAVSPPVVSEATARPAAAPVAAEPTSVADKAAVEPEAEAPAVPGETMVAGLDTERARAHEELVARAAEAERANAQAGFAADQAKQAAEAEVAAAEVWEERARPRAKKDVGTRAARTGAAKAKPAEQQAAKDRRELDVAELRAGKKTLNVPSDAWDDQVALADEAANEPASEPEGAARERGAAAPKVSPKVQLADNDAGPPPSAPAPARPEPDAKTASSKAEQVAEASRADAPAPKKAEAEEAKPEAPATEAARLGKAAEDHLAKGDYAKAREALQKLAALPGYEKDAKKKLDEVAKAEKVAAEKAAAEKAASEMAKRKAAAKKGAADEGASEKAAPLPSSLPRKSTY